MDDASKNVIAFYQTHADRFRQDRNCDLNEKAWLDRFLSHVPVGGHVLDLGCGFGRPIAEYVIGQGYRVSGVDSSPNLIEVCSEHFPEHDWVVADMRTVHFDKKFDGVLAWDSFFHLNHEDQAKMFDVFERYSKAGAPLMFSAGPDEKGVAVNPLWGEPLYHATYSKAEYVDLFTRYGFKLVEHMFSDDACGGRTIYLAVKS